MIKGNIIELIPATLDDRQMIYEWCFHSETTKSHVGPPDYPEIEIPTFKEFYEDYQDYFFTGARPNDGRGFLIVHNSEPVGFISYTAFHLKEGIAELDNWISSEANCGKGFGTDAILALGNYLHEMLGIRELIMAPSIKNARAVKAYEKVGLLKTDRTMCDFLLDEYVSLYGDGDYGVDETVVCVKQFDA